MRWASGYDSRSGAHGSQIIAENQDGWDAAVRASGGIGCVRNDEGAGKRRSGKTGRGTMVTQCAGSSNVGSSESKKSHLAVYTTMAGRGQQHAILMIAIMSQWQPYSMLRDQGRIEAGASPVDEQRKATLLSHACSSALRNSATPWS